MLPIFIDRYSGVGDKPVAGWNVIQLIFLMKEHGANALALFRGISLLNVVAKLYMGCLVVCVFADLLEVVAVS